jgi:hypothetical protein
MQKKISADLLRLREALEASWDEKTSYQAVKKENNIALGQCYPTARVVQYFLPETEIIKGKVWTGRETETHFWNGLTVDGVLYHIDLTWQQFPSGSTVQEYVMLDRNSLGDGESTIKRCELLLQRVVDYLDK